MACSRFSRVSNPGPRNPGHGLFRDVTSELKDKSALSVLACSEWAGGSPN